MVTSSSMSHRLVSSPGESPGQAFFSRSPPLSVWARGREFLLAHRLYRSHRTGAVSDPALLRWRFPPQWHHDLLRGLDYFAATQASWDPRLDDAIDLVRRARRPDRRWSHRSPYPGRMWFPLSFQDRAGGTPCGHCASSGGTPTQPSTGPADPPPKRLAGSSSCSTPDVRRVQFRIIATGQATRNVTPPTWRRVAWRVDSPGGSSRQFGQTFRSALRDGLARVVT